MEQSDVQRLMMLAEQNAKDIQAIKEEQRLQRRIVIGNGDIDKSLTGRVQKLEMRTGNVGYVVDKLLTPIITAIVTAVVVWALIGTP